MSIELDDPTSPEIDGRTVLNFVAHLVNTQVLLLVEVNENQHPSNHPYIYTHVTHTHTEREREREREIQARPMLLVGAVHLLYMNMPCMSSVMHHPVMDLSLRLID